MSRFNTYLIYNNDLHTSLVSGKLTPSPTNESGFYIAVFRAFKSKKDKTEIVFNFIYYPYIFKYSMILYLLVKEEFNKSIIYREWGDFFTVIDESLFENNLEEFRTDYNDLNEYLDQYIHSKSCDPLLYNDFYLFLFDYMKKYVTIRDQEGIEHLLSTIINKDYYNLVLTMSPSLENDDRIKGNEPKDFYLLKDCVFVVKDLDSLLGKLSKEFILNKGPKNMRATPNSLNTFLVNLDQDYRNSLFKHHTNRVNSEHLPESSRLARSKFTFKNFHLNIGNVRYYSTSTRVIGNKQQLFDDNYLKVDTILKKNGYIGSKTAQEQIEWMLFRQEELFSNMSEVKLQFNFNEDSYKIIESKYNELCTHLNYPDDIQGNKRINSAKYLPLILSIIRELSIEKTVSLLLSYFMYILGNETISKETSNDISLETPGIPTLTAFDSFGKEIFNKYLYNLYLKSDVFTKGGSFREFKDYHENDISNSYIYDNSNYQAYIGGDILWSLVSVGLLTEVLDKDILDNKKSVEYLRVSDTIRNVFIRNNVKIYKLPQKLPMICEPKDYILDNGKLTLGGYLLNDIGYVDKLIKTKIGHEVDSQLKEGNDIINLVNGISKVPYKININTLHYIYKYGYDKGIIVNDRDEDIQLFMNNPYKRMTKKTQRIMRSMVSKIVMERNILSIAEVYSKVNKIYFPVRLDFRSRVYCNTEYFDYQKSDLAKGLLLFSDPGVIKKTDTEVIQYFKAYGANMYGNGLDKKSLNLRVKWIDENSSKLLDFENNDIVNTAENKVCFISFCFEYKRFIRFLEDVNTVLFYTYLPIQLDATCNGYQHLALLTKEIKLLSKLNLSKSTYDEDPNDFYKFILSMTNNYIDSEIQRLHTTSSNTEDYLNSKKYYERLKLIKDLDLGRSIIKQVIMKESYSAGVNRLVQDILSSSDFESKDTKGEYLYKNTIEVTYNDIFTFVLTLKHVVKLLAPKVNKLTKYLNSVVDICTKLGMPIPWVTISGLEIKQSYLVEKERKIAAFTFTKSKYTFKTYLKGKYDIKHQKRAIRPNFIHSLDGTAIALLFKSLNKISIFTVHDCFAVTANNVPLLLNEIKLVYIHIYSSNNYLLTFDHHLRTCIKNVYKDDVIKDINDKYIYIPNGDKYRKTLLPDVMEVVQISNNNDFEEGIKQSIYPII